MIENTAAKDDNVTLNLYSEGGGLYSKTFDIPAGQMLKINLRSLQQDDTGNLLLGASGVMSIIGNHNVESKLAYDKIIHSADQSDYVGFPPNPCDYVTGIGIAADVFNFNGDIQPIPITKEYNWALSVPVYSTAFGSTSSNSSLAQITTGGSGEDMITFTPPDDGQTYTVRVIPQFPVEVTQNCVACSAGNVNIIPIDIKISIKRSAYRWDGTVNIGCNYIPTCTGTCTTSVKHLVGTDPPSCPNFIQCGDLFVTVSGTGKCYKVGLCHNVPVAGSCS
jgi:hypothetical protein